MDSKASDSLGWIQRWYSSQCNGSWEHEHGVTLETLDNPGWLLEVSLVGTVLYGSELPRHFIRRSESDWLDCLVEDGMFRCAGGPMNLVECFAAFRVFAGGVDRAKQFLAKAAVTKPKAKRGRT
ncbi:MAG: immunity 53 family protein [Planctomycetes bacterium]|nr:immunity 53 family protein [Planctomycetota bacterium]